MKFRPLAADGEITGLLSNDVVFNNFIPEFNEMRKNHYNDEITDEEFEDWKLSYLKNQDFKIKICTQKDRSFKLRSNFLSSCKVLGTIFQFILFYKCSHFNPSYSFSSSVTVDFTKLLIFLLLTKTEVSLLSVLRTIFRVKLTHERF